MGLGCSVGYVVSVYSMVFDCEFVLVIWGWLFCLRVWVCWGFGFVGRGCLLIVLFGLYGLLFWCGFVEFALRVAF